MLPFGLIQDRVEKLAEDIYTKYRTKEYLTVLVILNVCFAIIVFLSLKGSDLYFNDLLTSMRRLMAFDKSSNLKLQMEYVKVKSYIGEESSKVSFLALLYLQVTIAHLNQMTVTGRDVLIIEDIYDTGNSMKKILEYLDVSKH
jgi:hypoxanthine-guanine phosphoribosyltransferase